ncbi:MAG: DUF1592 domain-containing protein [Planctomycetota bacterium]
MRSLHFFLGLAVATHVVAQLPEPAAHPNLVERYCSECHVGDEAEREFDVRRLLAPDAAAVHGYSDRLALTVQRLRARTMPPPDADQPSVDERRELTTTFARLAPAVPGARIATIRRLTRTQYEHTVCDLFGITWQARDLLPDDASAHGFDGQGDVQNVSPLLFEKYLDAAGAVATAVLATPAARNAVFDDVVPLATTLPPFLARAFRRPVSPIEATERLADFDALLAAGVAVAEVRHGLLCSVLSSPSFIFRAESGRDDAPAHLSAHELAVRLAYLLTSSMPDAELAARADDGSLLSHAVLAAQARRLATLHEGRRLADDFAAQWLGLREVLTATADVRRYPEIWNGNLRPSFYEEAVRCFGAIVAEDRSVLELLDADSTFVDATLAKHYGLAKVEGGFRRVALDDHRRGGLLGMGAVLMASSYPLRTSPVRRGKWILDKLLDAPPPPPPPDAGTLPADDKQQDQLTLRQRLERHRRERGCASCHAQMDALGFALENFDVLGRWRTEIHGVPVDTQATLPDGTEIDGPVRLKAELLLRAYDFVRAMAKNLLVHGIGRDMTLADEPAIAAIVVATRAGGDRFSALLEAVVTSPLFTMRDPGASP